MKYLLLNLGYQAAQDFDDSEKENKEDVPYNCSNFLPRDNFPTTNTGRWEDKNTQWP